MIRDRRYNKIQSNITESEKVIGVFKSLYNEVDSDCFVDVVGNSNTVYAYGNNLIQINKPCAIMYIKRYGLSITIWDIYKEMSLNVFTSSFFEGQDDFILHKLGKYMYGNFYENGFRAKFFKLPTDKEVNVNSFLDGKNIPWVKQGRDDKYIEWMMETREKRLKKRTKSELIFEEALNRCGVNYNAETPFYMGVGQIFFFDFTISDQFDCIVEIDGEYHKFTKKKDRIRDKQAKYLDNLKAVFRIENKFLNQRSGIIDHTIKEMVGYLR